MRLAFLVGSMMLLAPASVVLADLQYNGTALNGISLNGISMNGISMNGISMNGISLNGISMNGISMNGVQLNGTMITGTLVDAAPSSCSHSETVTGAPLPSNCNACAQMVCNADAHCCSSAWDSTCVSEAHTTCAVTAQNLVGGQFTANMINPDGSTTNVMMELKAMALPPYYVPTYVCHLGQCWITGYRNEPAKGPNTDINLYQIEYLNIANSTAMWKPLCADANGSPYVDRDGLSNMATVVPGAWETRGAPKTTYSNGSASWTGGSLIPGSQNTAFTFSCRDLGATAKCEERLRYKPWETVNGVSLSVLHQACVRMLRADYCGDGVAHTLDGTMIDTDDSLQYQVYDPNELSDAGCNMGSEATWYPGGAWYAWSVRTEGPNTGLNNAEYVQTNCPLILFNPTYVPNSSQWAGWTAERSSTMCGRAQYPY